MAKLVFAAMSERASSSSNRPARNALNVGSRGDSPRAISSAFKNRIKPSRGSNSRASVVFPAPLQPPRMQRVGFMGGERQRSKLHQQRLPSQVELGALSMVPLNASRRIGRTRSIWRRLGQADRGGPRLRPASWSGGGRVGHRVFARGQPAFRLTACRPPQTLRAPC
jgi:hypothetical protein